MTIEYRAEMDGLIYPLFSASRLGREQAAALVKTMLRGEYFSQSPAAYFKAIEQALGQSDPVTEALEPPYSESEVREFLRLLHGELEKVKPWPGAGDQSNF